MTTLQEQRPRARTGTRCQRHKTYSARSATCGSTGQRSTRITKLAKSIQKTSTSSPSQIGSGGQRGRRRRRQKQSRKAFVRSNLCFLPQPCQDKPVTAGSHRCRLGYRCLFRMTMAARKQLCMVPTQCIPHFSISEKNLMHFAFRSISGSAQEGTSNV